MLFFSSLLMQDLRTPPDAERLNPQGIKGAQINLQPWDIPEIKDFVGGPKWTGHCCG